MKVFNNILSNLKSSFKLNMIPTMPLQLISLLKSQLHFWKYIILFSPLRSACYRKNSSITVFVRRWVFELYSSIDSNTLHDYIWFIFQFSLSWALAPRSCFAFFETTLHRAATADFHQCLSNSYLGWFATATLSLRNTAVILTVIDKREARIWSL